MPPSPQPTPSTIAPLVLEAGRTEAHYWRDLWRYRELFVFLTWRDLLVRYKQTVLGVLWALLQPAITMLVFTALGHWLNVPTGGAPRPVLVFAALLPWQLFANALNASSSSLVSNSHLISKVYFPRLLVPLSAVAVSLVDFLISAVFLAALMIFYGVLPGVAVFLLPLALLLTLAAALSVGLWLTALNVKYRDFRHILPFLIQLGLFISPVAFTSEVVPEKWKLLYSLNPMVGVIDTFRWALLGQGTPPLTAIAISCVIIAVLLFTGIRYFRQTERRFADLI